MCVEKSQQRIGMTVQIVIIGSIGARWMINDAKEDD